MAYSSETGTSPKGELRGVGCPSEMGKSKAMER